MRRSVLFWLVAAALLPGAVGQGGGGAGGAPPEGGGTPPEGGGAPPEGGGTPPEGGGAPPEGGGTPPEGGVTPPEGGGTGGGGAGGGAALTEPHITINSNVECRTNAAGPQTITGYIYCDNYFEFWFNGVLVKKDPMTFTPHNAVAVSFEWDGVSDKEYAIMCMDYASSSGYEYVETSNPGLGDGSLMAEFSDGTVTGAAWNVFVLTMGPTDASIAAGCSSSNLAPCAVVSTAEPAGHGQAKHVYCVLFSFVFSSSSYLFLSLNRLNINAFKHID